MERTYIKVKPSREQINPDDIVNHVSGLHKMGAVSGAQSQSGISKLNLIGGRENSLPVFSAWLISRGYDEPVEVYYETDAQYLDALHTKLRTCYPRSFDVEYLKADLLNKALPEFTLSIDELLDYRNSDLIQWETSSDDDTEQANDETAETENPLVSPGQTQYDPDSLSVGVAQTPPSWSDSQRGDTHTAADSVEQSEVDASGDDVDRVASRIQRISETLSDDADVDPADMARLREIDESLLEEIPLPGELDETALREGRGYPRWTEDGNVLAKPTLENTIPVALQWFGHGERSKDWMTPIKMFSKVANPASDDVQDRAPLASLIQHLAKSPIPMVYQVSFRRKSDWSRQAKKRKDDLHLDRDTWFQKIRYEAAEIFSSGKSRKERLREKKRDYFDNVGENTTDSQTPTIGEIAGRQELIDNKVPQRTFNVNIRAATFVTDSEDVEFAKDRLNSASTVLDHLDGSFYTLDPEVVVGDESSGSDGGLLSLFNIGGTTLTANSIVHDMFNNELQEGSGKRRPDLVLNADEISNLIAVPSSVNLTVEGVRGTRAEAKSRDPLPRPDPDLMEQFYDPGMAIGKAINQDGEPDEETTHIPPSLLTTHVGRFGTTGAGKSVSIVNDMLSLYENTHGPTILIDPKGDGLPEQYLRSHYRKFGRESIVDDVIHFPIPDVLPGFAFFNIQNSLEEGKRREDAVQDMADHYEELLKLVMGRERYNESKVAPIIIGFLIKTLYDDKFTDEMIDDGNGKYIGEDHPIVGADIPERSPEKVDWNCTEGHDSVDQCRKAAQEKAKRPGTDVDPNYPPCREGTNPRNVFSHHHLEQLADYIFRHGVDAKGGGLPQKVSDKRIRDALRRHAEGDQQSFSQIMNAVFNRLNYIAEDTHLRKIFDNMQPEFDFRDHIHDDKVIIFDLGDLREESTMVMTGLILTNLWDSVTEIDQSYCTEGHNSVSECKEYAHDHNQNPYNPPCREDWPEDHLVNVVIDEAASVAVSDLMDKMLEQGRSFNLSVELSMQYPEQMKTASGDRTYRNVINNIGSLLIGKIKLDDDIADTMSHEAMTPEDFDNRIKSLPRGEWVVQLPSPRFKQTGPEPFSVDPLDQPPGHEGSNDELTGAEEEKFQRTFYTDLIKNKVESQYAIDRQKAQRYNDVDYTRVESDAAQPVQTQPSPENNTKATNAERNGSPDKSKDPVTLGDRLSSDELDSDTDTSDPFVDVQEQKQEQEPNGTSTADTGVDNSSTNGSGIIGSNSQQAQLQNRPETEETKIDTSQSDTTTTHRTEQQTTTVANTTTEPIPDTQTIDNAVTDSEADSITTPAKETKSQTDIATRTAFDTATPTVPHRDGDLPSHIAVGHQHYRCLHCGGKYETTDTLETITTCCLDELVMRSQLSLDPLSEADTPNEQHAPIVANISHTVSASAPVSQSVPQVVGRVGTVGNETISINSVSSLVSVLKHARSVKELSDVVTALVTASPPQQSVLVTRLLTSLLQKLVTHYAGSADHPVFAEYTVDELQEQITGTHITIGTQYAIKIDKLLADAYDHVSESDVASVSQISSDTVEITYATGFTDFTPQGSVLASNPLVTGYDSSVGSTSQPQPINSVDAATTVLQTSGFGGVPGYTYPKSRNTVETTQFPVRQSVADCNISVLDQLNITVSELRFVKAIAKAYNNSLRGYSLAYPMGTLRSQYDVSINELVEKGLIKKEDILNASRPYYEPTDTVWNALPVSKSWGYEVGDQHDSLRHRVGAALFKEYYEYINTNVSVQLFSRVDSVKYGTDTTEPGIGGDALDGRVLSQAGEPIAGIEIEPGHGESVNPDTANIRSDGEQLAAVPGKSIWVVEDYETSLAVLKALNSESAPDSIRVSDEIVDKATAVEYDKNSSLNKAVVQAIESSAIDAIYLYESMWDAIL